MFYLKTIYQLNWIELKETRLYHVYNKQLDPLPLVVAQALRDFKISTILVCIKMVKVVTGYGCGNSLILFPFFF